MTKQELIEKMRVLLPGGRWTQRDFEYDCQTIQKIPDDEMRFIWMTRQYGTSIVRLDPTSIDEIIASESGRITMMKDPDLYIDWLLTLSNDQSNWYYFDGESLNHVTKEKAVNEYKKVYHPIIQNLAFDYPQEFLVRNKPLDLVFMNGVQEKFQKACELAQSIGDISLLDCIHHLTNYSRAAVDHVVQIYSDFAPYSFTFCEVINGQPRIHGGIIYHKENEYGHWQTHT